MRFLLSASLLPVAVLAQQPARSEKSGWTMMLNADGHGSASLTDSSSVAGTYRRDSYGFEAIHEGENHALDVEYYDVRNHLTGAVAADPDLSYGDTSTLRVSGFVQWPGSSGHSNYQLVGGIEAAPEDTLLLGDAFRWSLGGAYRWTPAADLDVSLGAQVVSRFERSLLPIPYVRAIWRPAQSASIEFRANGLQNGFYARWFATADKATSLDFACAYETYSFRLTDGTYGARGLGIGEVPIRIGVTQFLESSGTWFARVGFEWIALHRETFSHENKTQGVFEANDAPGWSLRVGARF